MNYSGNLPGVDRETIKQAAAGHWREILASVAGIDQGLLDGRGHPCPKCAGDDRFFAFKDVAESGGVMCRHCFEKGNGDGFSAIQWASGCDFPEALRRVSDYLQLQPFETVAGRANNTGRGQQQLGTWGTRDPAKHSYQGYGTLDEAIASALRGIRRRHPRAIETGRWHYQSNGEAFGTAVRFDTGDLDEATAKPKKEFRPIRRTPNGKWAIGKGDEPWPLYGVERLPTDGPVVVSEGEKAADLLNSLGVPTVTWQGGASAVGVSDWSSIAFRRVAVWPDHDGAGAKAASSICGQIARLNPDATVVQIGWADSPPKGDAVEAINGWTDTDGEWHPGFFGDSATPAVIAETIASWIKDGDPIKPESQPPKVKQSRQFARTDVGNSERFACEHGGVVKHVSEWGKWLAWDGSRWQLDSDGAVMRLAKLTVKGIISDAKATEDTAEQAAISKHWVASQACNRITAMLRLAESEQPLPVSHDSIDAEPWLLNCANGVVDLATGTLLKHDPGRLLSLTTGVEYPGRDDSSPALWLSFLDRTFGGDSEMIGFVQRLCGVALIGEQREHLLPVFHGTGANGKSVFVSTIQHVLGEYSLAAPPGLLMATASERHPTELASLFRRRLVVVSETKDGQKLDEGLVKSITGGDRITARRMREDFWQFDPSHLALIVTNHRPRVDGTDHGIWRRLRLVPFSVTIPSAERDPALPSRLRDEAPAILRWMVQGCLDWRRGGLQEPKAVMAATDAYQADSDALRRWLDDECLVQASVSMRASDGYERYQKWCSREGEQPMNNRRFGERMKEKFSQRRDRRGRVYDGVALGCVGSNH